MSSPLKVGDLVEIVAPIYAIQNEQHTIEMDGFSCRLKSRQFGKLTQIHGGYYNVRPIINGVLKRWSTENYEVELRPVRKGLDVYAKKVRMFKRKK